MLVHCAHRTKRDVREVRLSNAKSATKQQPATNSCRRVPSSTPGNSNPSVAHAATCSRFTAPRSDRQRRRKDSHQRMRGHESRRGTKADCTEQSRTSESYLGTPLECPALQTGTQHQHKHRRRSNGGTDNQEEATRRKMRERECGVRACSRSRLLARMKRTSNSVKFSNRYAECCCRTCDNVRKSVSVGDKTEAARKDAKGHSLQGSRMMQAQKQGSQGKQTGKTDRTHHVVAGLALLRHRQQRHGILHARHLARDQPQHTTVTAG